MSLFSKLKRASGESSSLKRKRNRNDDDNVDDDDDNDIEDTYNNEPPSSQMTDCTTNGAKIYQSSTHADVIHGNIEVDELCTRIIDTAIFKRLTRLKQLGCCFEVFRCADHTRFVHSLGVMHLANKVVKKLKDTQPELNITNNDVLCVKVAALCHDLGHGPFSHVFDGVLIPLKFKDTKWTHEEQSIKLLTHLLKVNKIDLRNYGLTELDKTFIDEMITGKKEGRRGRGVEKYYLYDVVNNIRSGLDVDKLDYFRRDMRLTNVTFMSSESYERFIDSGKVIQAAPIGDNRSRSKNYKPDWPYMMCYPEKMAPDAYEFFRTRFGMHNSVYTHKVVKAVEYMYVDAMLLADNFIKIKGSDGRSYSITESIHDVEAYSKLDDTVITLIKHLDSNHPDIIKAKAILERIDKRDLYKCVGKCPYNLGSKFDLMSEEQIVSEVILTKIPDDDEEVHNPHLIINEASQNNNDEVSLYGFPSTSNNYKNIEVSKDDVIIDRWHTHHGKKHENPVDYLRFFTPAHKSRDAIEIGLHLPGHKYGTGMLPKQFEMRAVRIFVRDPKKIDAVREKFKIWSKRRQGSPITFYSSQPSVNEDFADRFENSQSSI